MPKLNLAPLRGQIYDYLREEMYRRRLLPGAAINLNDIAKKLGISKTPLRDALIQLETEGFVNILPRRGVRVAELGLEDIKNLYEITGYIEGGIILTHFDRLKQTGIEELERLNELARRAILESDFAGYYELNLKFHGVFIGLSDNAEMIRILTICKQRLYDFPPHVYDREWELNNCEEHYKFIQLIKANDANGAAAIIRDVHWSYKV